jgi:hypothetical protein
MQDAEGKIPSKMLARFFKRCLRQAATSEASLVESYEVSFRESCVTSFEESCSHLVKHISKNLACILSNIFRRILLASCETSFEESCLHLE